MQKNSQDFNLQEALRLAKSPAGQQLLAMLKQSDPQKVQQAGDQARKGDYSAAMATVRQLLSTEEGQALLRQLGR